MKKYFTRTAVAALAAIAMTASFLSVSAATKTETKAAETAKEDTKKDDAAAKLAEETKVADADAKTIKIKNEKYRVDYVGDVIYKQVFTPGSNVKLKMDMLIPRLEDNKPAPVVVFVKGGGFTSMNLDGFMQQRMAVAEAGYAVVSVEHRQVPAATFPASIIDGKEAIRFRRAHAKEYNLNTDKIGIWGDSSGGYAATMVATSNGEKKFEEGTNLDQSSDVACCIDFYGPTDLTTIGKGLGEEIEKGHESASTTEAMLVNGTAFGTNPGGSVMSNMEKADAANPIKYIDKKDPAFLIFHGTEDVLVAPYESKILYQGLKDAGVAADLYYVEGGTHGGIDFYQPEIMDICIKFLDKNLK